MVSRSIPRLISHEVAEHRIKKQCNQQIDTEIYTPARAVDRKRRHEVHRRVLKDVAEKK